jgi:hypothetical protein
MDKLRFLLATQPLHEKVKGVVVVHVVVLLYFEFHLTYQTLLEELEINVFNERSIPTFSQLSSCSPSWRVGILFILVVFFRRENTIVELFV